MVGDADGMTDAEIVALAAESDFFDEPMPPPTVRRLMAGVWRIMAERDHASVGEQELDALEEGLVQALRDAGITKRDIQRLMAATDENLPIKLCLLTDENLPIVLCLLNAMLDFAKPRWSIIGSRLPTASLP